MKTAISLSDTLFDSAEETATYLGISRSKLFTLALEDYISLHGGDMVIKKINDVYEKIDINEFEPHLNAGLESIRNLTKNDSW